VPVGKDLAKAQAGTLLEWAALHGREQIPGASEVSFLLRRAAAQIGRTYDLDSAPAEPEPVPEDDPAELKAG
jgi:hypothetical protein